MKASDKNLLRRLVQKHGGRMVINALADVFEAIADSGTVDSEWKWETFKDPFDKTQTTCVSRDDLYCVVESLRKDMF